MGNQGTKIETPTSSPVPQWTDEMNQMRVAAERQKEMEETERKIRELEEFKRREADKKHPGSYEDLPKKIRELQPQIFEGLQFKLAKGLSSHFQITHSLNLTNSPNNPSGYKYGATFAGYKSFGPAEAYPILLGEITPSGDLNGNFVHQFTEAFRVKLGCQIQKSVWGLHQYQVDYKGKDFTFTQQLINPNLSDLSGISVSHYLQNVTPRLSLGGELFVQRNKQVPGGVMSLLSFAGRYRSNDWESSLTVCPAAGSFQANYYHKFFLQRKPLTSSLSEVPPDFQVGVEMESSLRQKECVAALCYQYELPEANFVFRGQADTKWTIGAVLEKRLDPLPFSLILSGCINYAKSNSFFGVGLQHTD